MDHLLVGGFAILTVLAVWISNSARFKGKNGERRVHSALRRGLRGDEFLILKDLTLPILDGTTQIDHIVISRFGIFVIETKNMQGWIFGSLDRATWTQTIYRRKFQFQNPVRQNYKHVKAVQAALNLDTDKIYSVVVFVGSSIAKTEMPIGVVWGTEALVDHIKTHRLAVFGEGEVDLLENRLSEKCLRPGVFTNRAHVKHVKSLALERKSKVSKCPRCGSSMNERINRQSGVRFLACARFPKCRGSRSISELKG